LLEGEHARLLVERAYTEIRQGELVDTYARSAPGRHVRKFRSFLVDLGTELGFGAQIGLAAGGRYEPRDPGGEHRLGTGVMLAG
jgi:hypothetical protein